MNDLKALGLTLAIDDFGTGLSSLSYLKNFPLDILKIDQAFVRQLESNESRQAIVFNMGSHHTQCRQNRYNQNTSSRALQQAFACHLVKIPGNRFCSHDTFQLSFHQHLPIPVISSP